MTTKTLVTENSVTPTFCLMDVIAMDFVSRPQQTKHYAEYASDWAKDAKCTELFDGYLVTREPTDYAKVLGIWWTSLVTDFFKKVGNTEPTDQPNLCDDFTITFVCVPVELGKPIKHKDLKGTAITMSGTDIATVIAKAWASLANSEN